MKQDMNKEFSLGITTRQDILDLFEEDEVENYEEIKSKIENLTDKQMENIAFETSDIAFGAHTSYYSYWDDLQEAFEKEIKDKVAMN